ncbi:MAG: kynureninase, partial [Bacteroidota bacterium]
LTESRLPLTIITPADPLQRGCQLSIMMHHHGKAIFDQLEPNGVICDWREPNVIRLAPVPLYNNFMDAFEFVEILKKLLKA